MSKPEHDRRIDYIELPATDLARAKEFYAGVFGWTFQDWGDDYSSFEDGRMTGGLRPADRINHGGPLVIMYAMDLEALQQSIEARGGKIVEPTFHFPGGRRFHFEDTEGNILAVWSDRDSDGTPITT